MHTDARAKHVPHINLKSEVSRAITDDVESIKFVEKMLTLERDVAESIVGKTSVSGYRRIHEVVGATIDRVIDLERTPSKETAKNLLFKISSAMLLVRWQMAREQLSGGLGNALMVILQEIQRELTGNSIDRAIAKAKRARSIIDSFAVLVYEHRRR